MGTVAEDVFSKALGLPEADRAELARRLLLSLEPEATEQVTAQEEAWAALIEERARSIDEGRATLVPWEEVRARLKRSLAESRKS